jgi:hypothetical protein
MRIFEYSPDCDRELLVAVIALKDTRAVRLPSEPRHVLDSAAMRANRTIRPKDALDRFAGFILGKGGHLVRVNMALAHRFSTYQVHNSCESTILTSAGPRWFIASSSAPRMCFGSSTKSPCAKGFHQSRRGIARTRAHRPYSIAALSPGVSS